MVRVFVIEADEYDCAFLINAQNFLHYHPRTTILNNLEYDHADIFPDLAAIQRQFSPPGAPGARRRINYLPGQDKALQQSISARGYGHLPNTRRRWRLAGRIN